MDLINVIIFLCKYYNLNMSEETLYEDIYSKEEVDLNRFQKILKEKLSIKTKLIQVNCEDIQSNYFPCMSNEL